MLTQSCRYECVDVHSHNWLDVASRKCVPRVRPRFAVTTAFTRPSWSGSSEPSLGAGAVGSAEVTSGSRRTACLLMRIVFRRQ
jgi:hypothetical protein